MESESKTIVSGAFEFGLDSDLNDLVSTSHSKYGLGLEMDLSRLKYYNTDIYPLLAHLFFYAHLDILTQAERKPIPTFLWRKHIYKLSLSIITVLWLNVFT